ncbi:hypothetical protein [Sphingomonas montanisoli]|uniref:Uncharacterized protein n=1 Tax=Sphingomonas montanisoli TaxID=2606412 RepID=A0A5D9C3K7_9SPHN|nr:hypothetical protein [Sphingomonas montanisoli]TZG26259.1 hypothetical protein FYJ91_15060 [Sphingomonas montanisoli]
MTIHPHIAVDASAPAEPPADLTDFAPVPVSGRHDGWTPDKQRAFIEVLADTVSVPAAAKAVGMGVEGAYRLRRRADAAGFAEAWDAAYGMMTRRLTDAAFARAIHGVTNPVYHAGEVVGERVQYDERLTRFLLERHDPEGYGRLMGCDPRWVEEKDVLRPRIRKLPHLLARLFGLAGDPRPEDAAPLGLAPPPKTRRR